MPNHKLHGSWRSFVIVDTNPTITLVDDREIFLKLTNPASVVLEPGSHHEGIPLSGEVIPAGTGFLVHFQHVLLGRMRHYEGFLIPEGIVGGEVLIMGGDVINVSRLSSEVAREDQAGGAETQEARDQKGEKERFSQAQGSWIATKP